jgi:hypothetical protein
VCVGADLMTSAVLKAGDSWESVTRELPAKTGLSMAQIAAIYSLMTVELDAGKGVLLCQ